MLWIFKDFDEILGSCDVANMPELKEVGAQVQVLICSNSET